VLYKRGKVGGSIIVKCIEFADYSSWQHFERRILIFRLLIYALLSAFPALSIPLDHTFQQLHDLLAEAMKQHLALFGGR